MSEEPIQLEPESEETENSAQEPEVETIITENTAAVSAKADRDAVVNNSAVLAIAAGRDMQMINSLGAGPLAVGRDLTSEQGVVGMAMVGNNANIQGGSVVGLLIASGPVNLSEGSRVVMTTQQAAAFGAALGAVFALICALMRKRK